MIKGTTESGFKFELNPEDVNDMEFVEMLAEVDNDISKFPKVIEMALGKDQKRRLYDHVRTDAGKVPVDKAVAEFGIYSQKVVKVYCSIPEYSRSFVELVHTLGFKKSTVDVYHDHRLEGKSSYNLYRLLKLSYNSIISNSNRPLHIAVTVGLLMSLLSFLMAIYNIFAKFIGLNEVAGYTSTIFSIWFVGGILLFMMGVLGLYIGKIFDQVKGRPVFIVSETLNL